MEEFMREPLSCDEKLLARLIIGWDNLSFCGKTPYLRACLNALRDAKGPVLECGSGLSTVLLGALAQRFHTQIYSLEHDWAWYERTKTVLDAYQIRSVRLFLTPLSHYDPFDWYVLPSGLPSAFSVVLCDGPPGKTRGGRYGLVPLMRHSFAPGCIIILDDVVRSEELGVAARWSEELGTSFTTHGAIKPYARLLVPSL